MAVRNKIVIHGLLGTGGVENWSTSVTFGEPNGLQVMTGGQLSEWCDDIMTLLAGAPAGPLRAMLSTVGTIEGVTGYAYPVTGPANSVGESTAAAIPGTSSILHPPQCTSVFSLVTGIPGRSFRGRCYWPNLTGPMTGALKWASPGPAAAGITFAQVLMDARDAAGLGVDWQPAVYSGTLDLVTPVTAVLTGDVIDTQRRRREDLAEVYANAFIV